MKRRIHSNNFVAKTEKELINKSTRELQNMPTSFLSTVRAKVPANCHEAALQGVEPFL